MCQTFSGVGGDVVVVVVIIKSTSNVANLFSTNKNNTVDRMYNALS